MLLKEAIMNRSSVRGFLKDPVPQEVIRNVLKMSTRAMSANNTQPWEFHVLTGEPLRGVIRDNMNDLSERRQPDIAIKKYEGIYLERSRKLGKNIFDSMSIEKDNKEHKKWWISRGFRFFDAPAIIVICIDKSLDDAIHRLDIGCLMQNICLAALDYGLGTCVAHQGIIFQRGIRGALKFVSNKEVICGIAIGYPDWEFPANNIVSERENVDDITIWYGF